MRKFFAILLCVILLTGMWFCGYLITGKVSGGFLYILFAAIFGSLGGAIALFIMNSFIKK